MHFIMLYHTTGVMQNKACVDIIEYIVMLWLLQQLSLEFIEDIFLRNNKKEKIYREKYNNTN